MSFRKQFASLASAAVATSVLAVAAPAHAVYTAQPFDPDFTPVAADLITVGSDTTEIAMDKVTKAFNNTAAEFNAASYQAGGGGTIPLPDGTEITRPNGSTNGKNTLHGATNNPNIDFARSSDSLNEDKLEVSHGLQLLPFALDTMKMGVSNTVASNAPASLSLAQILSIYKGECTVWTCVGGTSTDTIKPSALQQGSGTAKFFKKALEAQNGGAFTFGSNVDVTWQEHSDVNVKEDPNALAPFSIGRAALLGTTTKMLGGWQQQRALYNVVRGTSSEAGAGLGDPKLDALLGSNGFLCSPAATDLITQGGFTQLLPPAQGGVCGQATTSAPTNLSTEATATTTALAAASNAGGAATLTATVSPAAAGDVEFFVDGASVGVTQTQAGVATFNATGLTAGEHSFKAVFTNDFGTAYFGSEGTTSAVVKAASSTTVAFSPATSSFGKSRVIKATVLTGGVAATGTVAIKVGTAAAVNVALVDGVASYTVGATKAAGTYAVSASYLGNSSTATSAASKSLVITKAAATVTESFPTATLAGKPGKGVVKVAIAGSTVKPTGTVRIYQGTKLLKSVTLVNGQVTITLPKLTRGKKLLTVKYLGSANVSAKSLNFYLTQR
ncbi:Ig-like domain repeat protein [Nocardioides cavernaquae]|uniref:Bacterial Ig-like domain-containing protein n=1 Tax=Nocardioides cavernaquae TaxID=2321396 RepID=A0A3A5H7C2_9ACTN|nr:Ig-like domain repeat protein [Nocardioides cavernaquae]RJS45305.1 hypothetical protein D4739_03120 [Nocardioides cavernaquae]